MKKTILFCLILQTFLFSKNKNIEQYGDIIQIAIPTIAYATTLYLDDDEGETQFYKSFFSTFATTHILKRVVYKTRPDDSGNNSFPSGHTSASFQGAAFIHKRYGLNYAIIPYIGASYVGYSRIYADKHYTSDVICGALIGSGFSYYFTQPYKYKQFSIEPVVYNVINIKHNLFGVRVTW